jgi:hypothetical protein
MVPSRRQDTLRSVALRAHTQLRQEPTTGVCLKTGGQPVDRWTTGVPTDGCSLTCCPAYTYFDGLHPVDRWNECEGVSFSGLPTADPLIR